jgi:hypothetical protein
MDRGKLIEAKSLEEKINACDALLESEKDTYYYCRVTVECGNANSAPKHCATIPREIWSRMLYVLMMEKCKLEDKLDQL